MMNATKILQVAPLFVLMLLIVILSLKKVDYSLLIVGAVTVGLLYSTRNYNPLAPPVTKLQKRVRYAFVIAVAAHGIISLVKLLAS